jgi:hypothetical protein
MKIKLSYKTRDELPKGMEELYDEKDGEFVLTGVEGIKTADDITRLQQANIAIRADLKKAKDALATVTSALGDLKPEEVAAKLDLVDELQAQVDAAKGKGKEGDEAIDRIVETRVKRALAPVERERDQLKKQVGDLTGERDALSGTLRTGKIEDAVRKTATESKVIASALDDVVLNAGRVFELDEQGRVVTKDNIDGVTPGIAPDVWIKDMQEKRPHWWPTSQGGGAGGNKGMPGGGANPWSAGSWNMTHQGDYIKAHGIEKANQMAAQAGTKVGGGRPMAKAG